MSPILIKDKVELFESTTFNLFKLSNKSRIIKNDAFQTNMNQSSTLCLSCQGNEAVVLIFPCLHLILCVECSTNYKKIKGLKDKKCIACEHEIEEFFDLTMRSDTNHSQCRIF